MLEIYADMTTLGIGHSILCHVEDGEERLHNFLTNAMHF